MAVIESAVLTSGHEPDTRTSSRPTASKFWFTPTLGGENVFNHTNQRAEHTILAIRYAGECERAYY